MAITLDDFGLLILGTAGVDRQHGTSAGDTIRGFGSGDSQYGDGGNDSLYGDGDNNGTGVDGNDYQDGGDGYDKLYGHGGSDTQHGGTGDDRLYGDAGNDTQYGDAGYDHLDGGTGDDYLNGGYGNDHLWGGADRDSLVGGLNSDTFHFVRGDSYSITAEADTIWDWNGAFDRIDMPTAGTSLNYVEHATTNTSIAAVAAHANASHTADTYAFHYNSVTDTGYLVADLNNDNVFETGVILARAGTAADLNWSHII